MNRLITMEIAFGALPHELLGRLRRSDTEETWLSLPRVKIEVAPEESLASVVSRALSLLPDGVPDWPRAWLDLRGGANHPFQFYRGDSTPLTGAPLGPLVDDRGRIVWRIHDPALVSVAMIMRSQREGVLMGTPTRLYIAGEPTAGGPVAVWGPVLETWDIAWSVARDLAVIYTASQALQSLGARLRRGKAAAEKLVYTPAQAVVGLIRAREWEPEHLARLLGIEADDTRALIHLIAPTRTGVPAEEAAFVESLVDAALTSYLDSEPDPEALRNVLRAALVDLAEERPPPTVEWLPARGWVVHEESPGTGASEKDGSSIGSDAPRSRRRLLRRSIRRFRNMVRRGPA